jgi:hypothetical protein
MQRSLDNTQPSLLHAQSALRRLDSTYYRAEKSTYYTTATNQPQRLNCLNCRNLGLNKKQPIPLQSSSTVTTLTQGLTLTTLQAQKRWIVSTKVFDFDIANLQRSSRLSTASTAPPGTRHHRSHMLKAQEAPSPTLTAPAAPEASNDPNRGKTQPHWTIERRNNNNILFISNQYST